jgi:quinol monooxygenase YgiN
MILVTIKAETHPDKRTEFVQTMASLLGQIRVSPGCLSCHLYQEFQEENTLCLAEEWASQEDFENHLRSNSFCVLLGAMQILLKRPSEIKISDVSRSAGQERIDTLLAKSASTSA